MIKTNHTDDLGAQDFPLVPVPEPEVPVGVPLPVVAGVIHQEYWRILLYLYGKKSREEEQQRMAAKEYKSYLGLYRYVYLLFLLA